MSHIPLIDPEVESNKITTFIENTFQQADKTTAIVAVSGGLDSATSLCLAAKALGPKNVLSLHLPAKNSNPQHTQDAYLAMDTANIPEVSRLTINIGSIIQKTWRIMHKHSIDDRSTDKAINRLRLANLTARVRMMVLFDQAKKHDALVVGTENRSEHLLGYYTRFGDEASDLEPIRHLYKTQVIDLAKDLGVPQEIIDKPPSADLWPGQTDASELGFTYDQADPILYLLDQGKSKEEIISEGFDPPVVERVKDQVQRTQFKHQVPYSLPH